MLLRRMLVFAIALTMFPLFAAPDAEAATTTVRALTITEGSAGPSVPWKAFDGNPPKLYDINGDGTMEIIAQNDNHWAYIFNSRTGELVAELKATIPASWGARTFNGPEVAILEQSGQVHVILGSSAAYVSAYRFDPVQSTADNFVMHKVWDTRLNQCYIEKTGKTDAAMDSKVVFADLDQDGDFEILAATEEYGVYALRLDGSIFWRNCLGGGNAAVSVGDLNQDGHPDVIHGSDSGTVAALNGLTGDWLWGKHLPNSFPVAAGSITVQPGIGQLDGKGGPDIVVGMRDSGCFWDPNNPAGCHEDPAEFSDDHATLVALDSHGNILWSFRDPNGNPLTYTRPVVADADKDGQNEVYWADWNTVGHKPPDPTGPNAWATTGPANFYRVSATGDLVWKQTLGTWWNNKDLAIADVDGDGLQEVLANGPNGNDGIWYLNVETGAKEQWVSVHPYKVQRAPVVADLWGTGMTHWVVQVAGAASGFGPAILVYDTKSPYDAVWPHAPYPTLGDAPNPPPPSGDFDATFADVDGNEWWIQTRVATDGGALGKVDVRLDGGAWKPLNNEGWGWGASYHAPEGTIVQLRATSTNGATDLSGCFRWVSATPVECEDPAPPPPSGDFDASFSSVQGNEWWIQAQVSASGESLSRVDVRLDGGTWKALTNEGWGWAASYHIPEGTLVQLRATSSTGASDLSGCFRWVSATPVECGSTAPPQGGEFDATFSGVQGNEWWIQAQVSASGESLAKVEVSLNGGAWKALPDEGWGFAASYHAPEGTVVQFKATSTSGATDTSGCYRWVAATTVACGQSGDTDTDTFAATFSNARGGEWWVEVDVSTSGGTLQGVDARVDGGAWTALAKQSWGSWAKSVHAPAGSEVEFRARATSGETVISGTYTW